MAVKRDKVLKDAEKLVQKGKLEQVIREYEKILKKFYRILGNKGYLILGKVESLIGSTRDKFIPVNLTERIFLKKTERS